MDVEITKIEHIADDRIKDLLTCALEGGSNYWYEIKQYVNPNKVDVEFPHIELPLMDMCGVLIGDMEGDIELPRMLHRGSIKCGLQDMAAKYPKDFKTFIEENEDAETGDVFLQCCLFGEVVFV